MLTKKTVLDQIEVRADSGVIQIRLAKLLMNGEREMTRQFHRAILEPGESLDELAARVDAHLVAMGEAAVESWESVKRHAAVAHTPEVVQKRRANTAKA